VVEHAHAPTLGVRHRRVERILGERRLPAVAYDFLARSFRAKNEAVMNLLVVAAFEPELTVFRALAKDAGLEVTVAAIGVGLVEASIGATRAIALHTPSHALLLGTCGAFAPDAAATNARALAIGDVVTAAEARLVDSASVASHAALPAPVPTVCELALHDVATAAGARFVEVANPLGITTDDALAAKLHAALGSESPAAVEHLEAFAFGRACTLRGVVAGVVLGVANFVGSKGREQWRAHHVDASAKAARVAVDALTAMVRDGQR
jgi:nucleoside phosphorylase